MISQDIYLTDPVAPGLFYKQILEGTARYAGFTSSSCGGLRPPAEAFFALRAKKSFLYCFGLL